MAEIPHSVILYTIVKNVKTLGCGWSRGGLHIASVRNITYGIYLDARLVIFPGMPQKGIILNVHTSCDQ